MVRRLLKGGHQCVVFDRSAQAVAELVKEKATGAGSLAEFAKQLTKPRAIWLMVPVGAVDDTIADLLPHLERGDILIDGGNSYYVDDIRRANLLSTRPIFHKLDETIRGHVFCSFLALVLKKALEDRIAALGRLGSWPETIADLNSLTETEIAYDSKRFIVRSAPRPAERDAGCTQGEAGAADRPRPHGLLTPPNRKCSAKPPARRGLPLPRTVEDGSSMAALSSGACSRLRCRTAWRILRFRLGERALDAVVGFLFAGLWGSACSYWPQWPWRPIITNPDRVPHRRRHSTAPVSAFTIISASCSTHTILVRASSPGILARHKP